MTVTMIRTGDALYEVSGIGYEPEGAFSTDAGVVDVHDHPDLELALETGISAGRGDITRTESGWMPHGDPTEAALAVVAMKAGIHRAAVTGGMRELGEVPFSSERQLAAIFRHCISDGCTRASVAGAPHRVLDMCWSVFSRGASRPLDAETHAALERANADMAARGLRVLALAAGDVRHADEPSLVGLTFVALAGLSDSPAAGVKDAVGAFRTTE